MYSGGNGAQTFPLSVLENSVSTSPVEERGRRSLLAKKGKITPKVNVRAEYPLQVHIFSEVLFALYLTCAKQSKSVFR
jgi:microcystin-dependent protein